MDTIGMLGCGNMGQALIGGILAARLISPARLFVYDRDTSKAKGCAKRFRVKVCRSSSEVAGSCQTIILAVKPQDMAELLETIKPVVRPKGVPVGRGHQLIITIAAGLKIRFFERRLPRVPVIRVMPNAPALMRQGIAVLAKGRYATPRHLETARKIFEAVGEVIIGKESWLDAVTAVSGSGPAYVYYVIEAMIETGREIGLPGAVAQRLAYATGQGSLAMLRAMGETPKTLIQRIASKGGTTEAALKVFQARGLKEIIEAGIRRACQRSRELSQE